MWSRIIPSLGALSLLVACSAESQNDLFEGSGDWTPSTGGGETSVTTSDTAAQTSGDTGGTTSAGDSTSGGTASSSNPVSSSSTTSSGDQGTTDGTSDGSGGSGGDGSGGSGGDGSGGSGGDGSGGSGGNGAGGNGGDGSGGSGGDGSGGSGGDGSGGTGGDGSGGTGGDGSGGSGGDGSGGSGGPTVVTVTLEGGKDCLETRCPEDAPYLVGCDIVFSKPGLDSSACVALEADGGVFIRSGLTCAGTDIESGTLSCSAESPATDLTAETCIIHNKDDLSIVEGRCQCPGNVPGCANR